VLKSLKRIALGTFKSFGLFRLSAGSGWRRQRLLILCYHGVSIDDEHQWDPTLYVSSALFEQRLRLLRDGRFNVLTLKEGLERLYNGTLPPKSVVFTFDDGTFDFYDRARPLLKKYQFPATVYLTTFYCHHPRPVFRLFASYLLWKARDTFAGGPLLDLDGVFDLASEAGRSTALAAIERYALENRLPLAERDTLLERLAGQLVLPYETLAGRRILQLMTPQEVACLAADGIDVQLHTHRHRTPLDRDLFIREIVDNRVEIEDMTHHSAAHFCYPCGVYCDEFLPWLKEQGVLSATTCDPGLASSSSHPLLLPRMVDHSACSALEFESWLVGVGALLPRRAINRPGNSPVRA
jgi:peptidoglycan/xylan/chitin deacetylase (PgdA/CDA1 family)